MAQKCFRVSGRVQGVGFRAAARRQASKLGLNGWVRNLADGRVETLAQGNDAAVQAFEQWLAGGPTAARVDAVSPQPLPEEAPPDGFEIR